MAANDLATEHFRESKVKRRVYQVLEGTNAGDPVSRAFTYFIIALILLNVTAFVLETVKSIHDEMPEAFAVFETVSVAIFTVEYLLRLWSCTASPAYRHPLRGRLQFACTPLAIIDLLAILPFYLPALGIDLRFVRVIRTFRLFRLAKLARYSVALQTIGRVLRSKREELSVTLLCILFLLLFASTLMYFAENEVQPDKFSSIPASMWWAVITLTTIGYGDMYPVTPWGQLLASIIALLGIGTIALPAGILGGAFLEEFKRSERRYCPHCGKEL